MSNCGHSTRYRRAAEPGDAQAQFNLGVMYAPRQGVPQDFIRAHMGYNVAAVAWDSDDAREHRDNVASRMTAAQIGKAQKMERRCQQSQFNECD